MVNQRKFPTNAIKGAIETAAKFGQIEIFSNLIQNFHYEDRSTFFCFGASSGQEAIVQLFLNNPGLVGRQYTVERTLHNILHNCLHGGNPNIIDMVINHRSLEHSSKVHALRHAAANNQGAMVQRLVSLCSFSRGELQGAFSQASQMEAEATCDVLRCAMNKNR